MKDLDMPTTFCQQRHITAFFYAAFTIPMAVQLFSLGQEAVHPTELKTTKNIQSLSTFDDFPLLARICVNNATGLDKRKLESFGYSDPNSFYMGVSRFNNSIFGWSGHMENGSVFPVEGRYPEIGIP